MKNKLYVQFAGSLSLVLFAFLGYVIKFYPSWIAPFDQTITDWVRHLSPSWTGFFMWITQFANPIPITILVASVTFVLIYGKRYTETIWLTGGFILIAGIANPLLKLVFTRERPTIEHLVIEHSYSFPSGHAASSMLFYGSLLLLLPIFIKNKPVLRIIQILLGILIFSIGTSRIYLGVHFPSDILAGFSLGLGWLLLTYPIFHEQRFIWRFKNKQL
jgi:Membrane-associated phospholipid phosphatase